MAGSLYIARVGNSSRSRYFARGNHTVRVAISSNAPEGRGRRTALVLQSNFTPRQAGAVGAIVQSLECQGPDVQAHRGPRVDLGGARAFARRPGIQAHQAGSNPT